MSQSVVRKVARGASFALASGMALASIAAPAEAQRSRHADTWVFGTICRMQWNADATSFTPGTARLISTAEGSATFSSPSTGELLVYSDGTSIWDGAGNVVATGLAGDTSSMHSAIIIPRPLTPNRLFVITHGASSTSSVAYREIDTTGPVTALGSNTSVTLDGGATTGREGMTLIPHANGLDYWLLISGNNAVFVAPVTIAGIGTPVRVPTMVPVWGPGWHIFTANNAGTRLVISSNSGGPIVSFDFNRATGLLSGRTVIRATLDAEYYGGAFSPDDTKLYFTTLTSVRAGTEYSRVYQYDFTTDTVTMLDERAPAYTNAQARLAPDGKVYVATGVVGAPFVNTISVINNPNALGATAGFNYGGAAMAPACSPALGLPQTVSPSAILLFGLNITAPVGNVASTSVTPAGTANVPNGTLVTVNVSGPGGFTDTCTATVMDLMWSCPPGSIDGLMTGATYTTAASISPAVRDTDTFTVVDCLRDSDCNVATDYCNTESFTCSVRVPNSMPVPTVGGHTPPLTGMCTPEAADSACLSRVCETADDLCGYRNGPMGGPCTVANGAVVCRSGVCSPSDSMCGYREGEGPCTPANAGTVCRSGACGVDGLCRPETGCNVDADCETATQYCNTPARVCVARIPNSMAVPTVPGHTPELAGACTPAAAMSACLSNVCESSDDLCGYLNGTPCAALAECRSMICHSDAACGLPNGEPCTTPGQCRSDICAPDRICGECDASTPCPSGLACDIASGSCVPVTDAGAGDAGIGNVDAGRPGGLAGGACGCTVNSTQSKQGYLAMLALLGLVVARKRRQR